MDGLNSYSCECGGTGYAGADCDVNIDECAPQPCRHGGTCVDDVNDYHCNCYTAYTGQYSIILLMPGYRERAGTIGSSTEV